MIKRDSQKTAVYTWESPMPDGDDLSLAACRDLVEFRWDDKRPGERPPKVKDGRGRKAGWANRWEIDLPWVSRWEKLVIHETCHSLLPGNRDRAWHGPEWAFLYVKLLEEYDIISSAQEWIERGIYQRPRKVRFS